MKIARLLLLAVLGPLSGSACHVYAGDGYPRAPETAPATTAVAPPPSTAAPVQGSVSPNITTIHLQSAAPPAAAPAAATPSTAATATAAGSAAGCADSGAAPVPDCSGERAADPGCLPYAAAQQKCGAFRTYFNPKIAATAVACMMALSSKQLCDPSQWYNCSRGALAQACPDPSVAQLCNIAATACKSSPSECTTILSGLNDQGKQKVAQCVAQGCAAGLASCVDGLTSAAVATKALAH